LGLSPDQDPKPNETQTKSSGKMVFIFNARNVINFQSFKLKISRLKHFKKAFERQGKVSNKDLDIG